MPKYVIERDIPGVGNLSGEQLQAISQKSCDILRSFGPQIQWLHSYVTGAGSTASILPRTKQWFERTLSEAASLQTASLKSSRLLIQQQQR